jgi:hypothetical protein
MGAYHQMGYQSDNLLLEPELSGFYGVVLSPVNYAEEELQTVLEPIRYRRTYDIVFDPQLYFPRTQQKKLREWSYFEKQVKSTELRNQDWWAATVGRVLETAKRLKVDAVCSPADLPKIFSDDDYFVHLVDIGNELANSAHGDVRCIQSVIVSLAELTGSDRAMTIASIISRTACPEIYLVLVGPDMTPRRELSDGDELKGALKLIGALKSAGLTVTVAFSSSDILLWKAAGAAHCGTGKFFNLRRFTRQRFEDPPAKGGGAMAYWFEESLIAFARETDLVRLRARNLLGESNARNPYTEEIFGELNNIPPGAWLGLAWRQYLWWFADIESRIDQGVADVNALLVAAEEKWTAIEKLKPPFLMDEQFNTGAWIRPWRRALVEYEY